MSETKELEVRQPGPAASLPAKIQYAKLLADSGLLPGQYRHQPANVLWAAEYGEMLGLAPMAAITGVHVIEGKPTASAGLISALVRRAGHKLRVGYDAAKMMGWAEIVRSDDPDYTFRSEWTLDRAVTAELCTIQNGKPFAVDSKGRSLPWRKFFPSMTKARAITEVARDACEEVLFGLHYTPEELGAEVDEEGNVVAEAAEPVRQAAVDEPAEAEDATVVETDEEWYGSAVGKVPHLNTVGEAKGLWAESAAMVKTGKCTTSDAAKLQEMLRARVEELGESAPRQAAGELDGDDPWVIKIRDMASPEEAEDVRSELAIAFRDTPGDDPRVIALFSAWDDRVSELTRRAAA